MQRPLSASVLAFLILAGSSLLAAGQTALTQTVRHPQGVTIRVPANWKASPDAEKVTLVPPNPNPLGKPPSYLFIAIPRGEILEPADSRIVAYLDKQSTDAAPHMKRSGPPQAVDVAGGRGVVLTYEGTDPGGLAERGRIYVAVCADKLVFLMARSSKVVMRRHEAILDAVFATATAGATAAKPGGYAGEYASEKMTVKIAADGAAFRGEIRFGGNAYPFTAALKEGKLQGAFTAGENRFPFTATLKGDTLTLVTGNTRYVLKKKGAAANPLAGGGAPANPLAGAGSTGGTTPAPAPAAGSLDALANLGPVRADPNREWTIAVYLDGDNDLEPFALKDLVEMEFGMPDRGVEIIALLDRAKGFEEGAGNWTDARVYRVRKDNNPNQIASQVLCTPGELNMGDPAVLSTFLGAVLKTFPARNHMLILWDHGGGWASMASDFDAPGAPEGHDSLNVPELRAGVEGGLEKAGKKKLEAIGFDMCLMAQLETAVELEGLADVMIASQAIEPGNGWPYNEILPQIGKGTLGSRRIAQEIVRAYSRFYDEKDAEVATLSALDLRVLPDVQMAFEGVVGKLGAAAGSQWPAFSRSIFYSEAYAERTDVRRGKHALASVDMLDMLKRLRYSLEGFPAEKEYRQLVDAMDRMVLASHTSRLRHLSNGLAIYAPVHGSMVDPEYMKTKLGRTSAWPKVLGALHRAQQTGAQKPVFRKMTVTDEKGRPIDAVEAMHNDRVTFDLEGDNIVWTQAWFGRDEPKAGGMIVFFKGFVVDPLFFKKKKEAIADVVDLIMPQYEDGLNHLYQDVTGLTLKVTDGKSAYPATIDYSNLNDPKHIRVPVLLEHPEAGRIGATILFDSGWWQVKAVLGEIPQADGRVMYRQVEPPPETKVTLLLETVKPSGEIGYAPGASFQWGEGPELLLDSASPGTYRVAMIAETIGGEQAVQTTPVRIKESPWIKRFTEELGKFDVSALVGTWDHYLLGDTERPSGLVFKISPHPRIKGLLVADVTHKTRPEVKIHQVIWVDNRLLPSIRIFEYDDKGNEIGFYLGVCGYGTRKGKPTLVYKMTDVTRLTAALVRRGGPAPGAGTPGAGTQPGTEPRPAAGLAGKWQDGQGTVLVCDATRYALYMFGELVDQGRYVIQDNVMTAQSADGEVSRYRIALSGNTLILEDAEGTRIVLKRVE